MAYNPDAVSSMSPGIRLLFYATSSPFLAATPSPVGIRPMHSASFSVPRRGSVCVNKEHNGITELMAGVMKYKE